MALRSGAQSGSGGSSSKRGGVGLAGAGSQSGAGGSRVSTTRRKKSATKPQGTKPKG